MSLPHISEIVSTDQFVNSHDVEILPVFLSPICCSVYFKYKAICSVGRPLSRQKNPIMAKKTFTHVFHQRLAVAIQILNLVEARKLLVNPKPLVTFTHRFFKYSCDGQVMWLYMQIQITYKWIWSALSSFSLSFSLCECNVAVKAVKCKYSDEKGLWLS